MLRDDDFMSWQSPRGAIPADMGGSLIAGHFQFKAGASAVNRMLFEFFPTIKRAVEHLAGKRPTQRLIFFPAGIGVAVSWPWAGDLC